MPLKSFNKMTKEEHLALSRKGGINSAAKKKEKKKMREIAEIILSAPLKKGKAYDISEAKCLEDLNNKNITVQDRMIFAQIKKAFDGDTVAFREIRSLVGETIEYDRLEKENEEDSTVIEKLDEVLGGIKSEF